MEERLEKLAEQLCEQGVQYAFGVTGSGASWTLITALEERGVRFLSTAHEAAAALMAGAATRAAGRLAVSISIKGPGLANMLPGIVANHFECSPTLSISEAFGDDIPAYRMHKRLHHPALLAPVVKGIVGLNDLGQCLETTMEAARHEVPGPVHLELCTITAGERAPAPPRPEARRDDTERAAFLRALKRAAQPLLVVGSLATRRRWRRHLTAVRVPTLTTVSAKGVVDERLAHSAGVFTGAGKELAPETRLLGDADLVVAIGLRNTEVLQPEPFEAPLILLDEVDAGLARGFEPEVLCVETDEAFAREVLEELERKAWGAERVQVSLNTLRDILLEVPWLPAHCFEFLSRLAYPHALVVDTGSFCTIGEHLWHAAPERYFLGCSNSRNMGAALPSAIGLALSRPNTSVFCAVGDGGMRMYPAEIKLMVDEDLPLCIILMRDGLFGSVACTPQSRPMSPHAVSIVGPSWVEAVEAMGCPACAVTSQEKFEAAVNTWERDQPLFIEAVFDPEAYARMTERLR